ncbi:MAG: DUF456 family protein [Cyanobium sp.]
MTPPSAAVLWWVALIVQVLAIPGVLLPVMPGLVLLPLGALIWIAAVGWPAGWPVLLLETVLLLLGWGSDALGLLLGAARLRASRWAYLGAALGLVVGLFGLMPALPVGGPLLGAVAGPLLGASLGEGLALVLSSAPAGGAVLLRSLQVGLAVVAGMLVSRVASLVLALIGVGGFLALTLRGTT